MKNILVVSDSFKGSLRSKEICALWEEKVKSYSSSISCRCFPFADGGEGSLDSYLSIGGNLKEFAIENSYFKELHVPYIENGDTMIIECASVIGLPLFQNYLNPLKLNTFDLGKILKYGLDKGFRKYIIFLGGSATIDGGIGLAEALGFRFFGKDNKRLSPIPANMEKIERIDMTCIDQRLKECSFTLAVDVANPLVGEDGCAIVFGPQKKASPEDCIRLNKGLENLANVIEKMTQRSFKSVKGLGAAGGLGLFLYAFYNAEIQSGAGILMEWLNLENEIRQADLIITGEGRFDSQSLNGKLISYLINDAHKYRCPIWVITGINALKTNGYVDRIIILNQQDLPLEQKMLSAKADYSKRVDEILSEIVNEK